jgi:hypothetical protein
VVKSILIEAHMKRILFFTLLVIGFASSQSVATAGALGSLPTNGVQSELRDDDWELLVKAGHTLSDPNSGAANPNKIEVGDMFVGVIRIKGIYQPVGGSNALAGYAPNTGTFTAVFAIKVTSVPGGTGLGTYGVGTLSASDWSNVGLSGPGGLGLDLSNLSGTTVAVVYDSPIDLQVQSAGDGNPLPDIQSAKGSISQPATKLWEFGLVTPNNFWFSDAFSNLVPPVHSSNSVSPVALFGAGLDVTYSSPSTSGITLMPQTNSQITSVFGAPIPGGGSQLLISGSVKAGANTDFNLISTTSLYVTAYAPEPGSMVLLGMGALGFFGVGARRRRPSVKQQAV